MTRLSAVARTLFCIGAVVSLIGALRAPGLAKGAETLAPRSADADSLSAAAVAFELRYGPIPNPAAAPLPSSWDRWFARDKVKHVTFSGLWTLSTQYVLVSKADWTEGDALPASIASAAAVGVAKEVYDASRPTETASGKDLVANAVGIGLAVVVILL